MTKLKKKQFLFQTAIKLQNMLIVNVLWRRFFFLFTKVHNSKYVTLIVISLKKERQVLFDEWTVKLNWFTFND